MHSLCCSKNALLPAQTNMVSQTLLQVKQISACNCTRTKLMLDLSLSVLPEATHVQ